MLPPSHSVALSQDKNLLRLTGVTGTPICGISEVDAMIVTAWPKARSKVVGDTLKWFSTMTPTILCTDLTMFRSRGQVE